ncbi:MAG: hypothetical protein LBT02_01095 [Rickettsiales bacterium]|jgi:hypothetical protein|nr:hypothetical protein [Rickettsiales bacterium]
MNKTLINICCWFIPKKKNKKHFREKHGKIKSPLPIPATPSIRAINYQIQDNKFATIKIQNNTVAVIEVCWHGEVFPSIVNYYSRLGYNVHLFLSIETEKLTFGNPLTRTNFSQNVEIFYVSRESFLETLKKTSFFTNYKSIFIPSIFDSFFKDIYGIYANINTYIKNYGINNVFYVEHDFIETLNIGENLKTLRNSLVKAKHVFSIRPNVEKLPFLTCSYFGKIKKHKKNEKIKFIASGGIWKGSKLRNFDLLFETIKKLIKNNIINFEVVFTGVNDKYNFKDLEGYLKFYNKGVGCVPFYNAIENGDFILWNIDSTCDDYDKYLNFGTSGTYGLTLGFHKIPIIEENLAKKHNFTKNNAILYGDLYEAMKRAIEMKNNEYDKMENEVKKLKEDLEKKSLNNLANQISLLTI